jgi:hypothetical protein
MCNALGRLRDGARAFRPKGFESKQMRAGRPHSKNTGADLEGEDDFTEVFPFFHAEVGLGSVS